MGWPGSGGWDTIEFVIDAMRCRGDRERSTSPAGKRPDPGPLPRGDSCLPGPPGDLRSLGDAEGLSLGLGVPGFILSPSASLPVPEAARPPFCWALKAAASAFWCSLLNSCWYMSMARCRSDCCALWKSPPASPGKRPGNPGRSGWLPGLSPLPCSLARCWLCMSFDNSSW